jgi:hypothetical protein
MKELKEKVAEWLSTSGYPLEMTIAQALQTGGFTVVQSEYFEDHESSKWREADVVAYQEYAGNTRRGIFSIVIECKGRKDKPWVLFTSADTYPTTLSVTRRATSKEGESILSVLALNDKIAASALFSLPSRPAYGMTAALRTADANDQTYEALTSVCKSAIALVRRVSRVKSEYLVPFVWPMIVIDAPLFECYLDDRGALQVDQIEKGLLIWRNPAITRHSLVHIYTRERFLRDISEIRSSALEFLELASSENDRSSRFTKADKSATLESESVAQKA